MRRRPLALAGLVLFLVLSLGLMPAFARPMPSGGEEPRVEAAPWTWAAAWDALKQLMSLLKNGSGIDPFGNPQGGGTPPPPSTTGDNGSGIDPFGGK